MANDASAPIDPEVVLLQVASAIGQGAATIRAGIRGRPVPESGVPWRTSPDRLDPALWPSQRAMVTEWARALGRTAAALAVSRGAVPRSAFEDLQGASALVLRSLAPDGVCPFT